MAKEGTQLKNVAVGVLKNPRITEKAAHATASNAYVFNVSVGVTKSEIAKAFFAQYNIKPVKVNVVNNNTPKKITRGTIRGTKKIQKKAYVYLPKGKTIEIM